MDVNSILFALLIVAGIVALVALAVLFLELVKMGKTTRQKVEDLDQTLKNVESMTTSLTPAMTRVDPLMERITLTVDSVNLEMMRVDQILEDLTEITDTASSATTAVDNIASAPVKAVNNVATKVKNAFGAKSASDESAQLAEQRVAVARALEDYKAAEAKEAAKAAKEAAADDDAGEEPVEYIEIKEEAAEEVVEAAEE